jgi:uncharacterized membrane protein
MQIKLRNIARLAASQNQPLPQHWYGIYRVWFACGFPAFFSVAAILWLMLMKPKIAMWS